MGANVTQLSRLDTVQNTATALCHASIIPLQRQCHAATVELPLGLLDCRCRELLQTFCPSNLTLRRSSRLATSIQPYWLRLHGTNHPQLIWYTCVTRL